MQKTERKYYLQAFFLALATAMVSLLPIVIYSGGFMTYYGDFNGQQIPFLKLVVDAIHNGDFRWNWTTALGQNFVSAYGSIAVSPFTWISALFPSELSQYTIAPILALKMALCSLTAFAYIRRFVKRPESAVIGGLLYAFSGWSLYNIVYYLFHEALILFPLLLIALEEAVVCKRRGVFALTVAACLITSYFFFYEECILLVIYFILRMALSKDFRINLKDFFCLAFESVVGVMIACFIFLPNAYTVFSLDRVGSMLNGNDLLFYDNAQRYGVILSSLILPPGPASKSYFFNDSVAAWQSCAAYLPLFSMAGVIAFFRNTKKNNWLKMLLTVLGVMAFVPGLNALFSLMNSNYYARWFFMPILFMCLATVQAFEDEGTDWRFGFTATAAATGIYLLAYLLIPTAKTVNNYDETDGYTTTVEYVNRLSLPKTIDIAQILLIALAVLGLVILGFTLRSRKRVSRDKYFQNMISYVVIVCLLVSGTNMFLCRLEGSIYTTYKKALNSNITIEDDEYFRIGIDTVMVNFGTYWGYADPSSFTSMNPVDYVRLTKAIDTEFNDEMIANYPVTDIAFNALSRTKYYVQERNRLLEQAKQGEEKSSYMDDIAYGTMEYYDTQGVYDIFKSKYTIPCGYAYETYCTPAELKTVVQMKMNAKDNNLDISDETGYTGSPTNLMLHSVVLDKEAIEEYAPLLEHEALNIEELTFEQYLSDMDDRTRLGVDSFEITKTGFKSRTSFDADRFVVYSVAYEDGWSAEIDGEPVKLDNANYAFIGLRVPAGEHEIVFTYTAPLLKEGIIVTIAGVLLLAGYCAVIYLVLKRRPKAYAYPTESKAGVELHSGYIKQLTSEEKKDEENS